MGGGRERCDGVRDLCLVYKRLNAAETLLLQNLSLFLSLGVTRHGVVLTDLQSLVDCQ